MSHLCAIVRHKEKDLSKGWSANEFTPGENTDTAPDGAVYTGKQAIAQFWQDFFTQSPQAHIKVEEIFGLGIRCIMRWRYEWVDQAGNPGHARGVYIFRVQNGVICEKLSYVKG